jgi:uncharacterized protein
MSRIVRTVREIAELAPAEWDACANPADAEVNPFLSHAFLHALEASGSVAPARGWQPVHLVADDPSGAIAGAVPMYLKSHSRGEYVFDHAWADAWHRAGGRYYPKLQVAVPFTPVTGPRLLARTDAQPALTIEQLLAASVGFAEQLGVSSLHLTFLPRREWEIVGDAGLLQRTDRQFHWHNRGYGSFDDFLGDLSSRKRKNVRRERRDALATGIEIEWISGSDLREHHWDAFYRFYMDTGGRKWGSPYLTREFFSLVSERMADRVLLVMCRRGHRYVAGALNFIGSHALFGRNWGCIEDHPFLHFEACYYQAIEFAISRGLDRVEAGAQGEHKVARGYLPVETYSAHWIQDARLRDAIAAYLAEERAYVREEITVIGEHNPFRRNGSELRAD